MSVHLHWRLSRCVASQSQDWTVTPSGRPVKLCAKAKVPKELCDLSGRSQCSALFLPRQCDSERTRKPTKDATFKVWSSHVHYLVIQNCRLFPLCLPFSSVCLWCNGAACPHQMERVEPNRCGQIPLRFDLLFLDLKSSALLLKSTSMFYGPWHGRGIVA